MRCLACGAEMQLVQVVADDTMPVSGYEHHTFECMGCTEVEHRLVFRREPTRPVSRAEPTPIPRNEPVGTPSAWARAVARLRSQQIALEEQAAHSRAVNAVRQMMRPWDDFTRDREVPPYPPMLKEHPTVTFTPHKDRYQHSALLLEALADVVGRLRNLQPILDGERDVDSRPPLARLDGNLEACGKRRAATVAGVERVNSSRASDDDASLIEPVAT
jgi:hypothetical protein